MNKCCQHKPELGRAFDGRRAYRCKAFGKIWTNGTNGRATTIHPQRQGYQFPTK